MRKEEGDALLEQGRVCPLGRRVLLVGTPVVDIPIGLVKELDNREDQMGAHQQPTKVT
jgi:hypothetical protein